MCCFFFQAEDGIRDGHVTGVQTCALPISQYRKFRPSEEEFSAHRAKAWLKFASTAILEGVRERRRKWAWEYFRERRDDRRTYVDLFQRRLLGTLIGEVREYVSVCRTISIRVSNFAQGLPTF